MSYCQVKIDEASLSLSPSLQFFLFSSCAILYVFLLNVWMKIAVLHETTSIIDRIISNCEFSRYENVNLWNVTYFIYLNCSLCIIAVSHLFIISLKFCEKFCGEYFIYKLNSFTVNQFSRKERLMLKYSRCKINL